LATHAVTPEKSDVHLITHAALEAEIVSLQAGSSRYPWLQAENVGQTKKIIECLEFGFN